MLFQRFDTVNGGGHGPLSFMTTPLLEFQKKLEGVCKSVKEM